MSSLRSVVAFLFLSSCFLYSASLAQAPDIVRPPAHLLQAEQLVENLRSAQENVYGRGKRHIEWDASRCSARTVCSSFITLLLQHSYGWSSDVIEAITGSTNPEANDYHDAIVGQHGFKRILHISALRAGDLLAVKYTDGHISSNGVQDTGHVMLVCEPPTLIDNTRPMIPETQQYTVTIIDSSASGHGPTDTRAKPNGGFTGGIGRGVFRLYANADGRIVGYTWSDTPESPYFTGPARDLVAGRLKSDEF